MSRVLLAIACALTVLSCSKGGGGGGGGGGLSGCIQGVVVNGLTAERVGLPGETDKGLFVLVQDYLIPGSSLIPTPAPADANPALLGEYVLCGVPLDEEFPVFVWLDGFLPFEGQISVRSTTASRSPLAKSDIPKPSPTEIVNIRVYPKNQQVQDLEVRVTHNGAPLAGAQVVLRAIGTNFLDPVGMPFLPPRNIRSPTLTGTTDAAGLWTVAATELVLGGHYTYVVIPPNGGQDHTVAADTFVVGLRDAASTDEPYRITVDLDHSIGQLAVLSLSTDRQDPEPTGKLTVFFNREFEVVPGTEDSITATLAGATVAVLATEVPNNKQADRVNVAIDRNVLTLEPVFQTAPSTDLTLEPLLAVTYSGLVLRPIASPDTLSSVTVNETVRFYR